ncbi:VWA domain-containing protein [Haloplanus salilacus]|uniref:VWA domain-containing protein n=1 Tax=Haloplanus salilacus TaxID=2949994 RepID=UPI003CCCF76F
MLEYTEDKNSSGIGGERVGFDEIVGQSELKRALLAVGANDALDGLLIRGEKGTAKSTAVRALSALLPDRRVVADCPYGCPAGDPDRQCANCRERADPPTETRSVPLVTLPLGATRERVVGTLSVADALDGDYEFDPGLLARANGGILYVDEVNLLDDHLVDVLLDAAAGGVNRVERDGVSVAHPAAFTLVGTMNPEEGELRPQLRDRFALQATVTGCDDIEDRVAIVDRALGRESEEPRSSAKSEEPRSSAKSEEPRSSAKSEEPRSSAKSEEPRTPDIEDPATRLSTARDRLSEVTLPDAFVRDLVELCRDAGVEGHRADIATARAARTFAALDDRPTVIESDVRRAAELALPHRLESLPFDDAPDLETVVDDHFDEGDDGDTDDRDVEDGAENGGGDADDADADGGARTNEGDASDEEANGADGSAADDSTEPTGADDPGGVSSSRSGDLSDAGDDAGGDDPDADAGGGADDDAPDPTPRVPGERPAAVGSGRAPSLPDADDPADASSSSGGARARASVDGTGARVRTRPTDGEDVDAAASVRAAAARGVDTVESRDLRRSVRAAEASTLVVFSVDASASMRPAMRAAKGTVLELLEDTYQQRDRVSFVAFAGEDADVLLPPTDSVTLAARHLKQLPTGDRTPLPAGLRTAGDVIERADPAASVVVLVTDGRANVADGSPVAATRRAADRLSDLDARVLVVDAGSGDRSGLVPEVVERTTGRRVPLDALSADAVDAAAGAVDES